MSAGADTLAATVGAALKAARGSRTLRELARTGGLSHTTLYELEQGENNPTLARLERTARLYGVRLVITAIPDNGNGAAP